MPVPFRRKAIRITKQSFGLTRSVRAASIRCLGNLSWNSPTESPY